MLTYTAALEELPLFVRDGAVLPYFAGPLRNGCMDLSAVELHLFCHDQPARFEYALDDQKTQRYETIKKPNVMKPARGVAQASRPRSRRIG